MNRRNFTSMTLLGAGLGLTFASPANATASTGVPPDLHRDVTKRLREIERGSRGRLGVQIVDTANGAAFGHRANERFLMCSTFKLLAAALVLHRVDLGRESLGRRIAFGPADLVVHSPVTGRHAGGEGMTLAELCAATLTTSDNTAANLILASYGGPRALTAFARSLGDTVTRLDRIEPALNTWRNAVSDTTSPRAMLHGMRQVMLGEALKPASRTLLQQWLRANTTGDRRLKAGLPAGWAIGDKTGTSANGSHNDIAVVWPPNRAPLLVTAYLARSSAPVETRDATLAKVGQLLATIAASA
jgi:beta-lactamase class A